MDRSRIPARDICSVRGIGVAVSVRTSRFVLRRLIFSLSATPKRCSSSMMSSPGFLNSTSFDKSRCVPMTISILPLLSFAAVFLFCSGVRKRDIIAILTGNFSSLCVKVL